jgi:hypothetical protein
VTNPDSTPPPKLWAVAACSGMQAAMGWAAAATVAPGSVVPVWQVIPTMAAIGLTLMVVGELKLIAMSRGQRAGWAWMGFLGPIGVAVVYCLPDRTARRTGGFPVIERPREGRETRRTHHALGEDDHPAEAANVAGFGEQQRDHGGGV